MAMSRATSRCFAGKRPSVLGAFSIVKSSRLNSTGRGTPGGLRKGEGVPSAHMEMLIIDRIIPLPTPGREISEAPVAADETSGSVPSLIALPEH